MMAAAPVRRIQADLRRLPVRVFTTRTWASLVRSHPEWASTPAQVRTALLEEGSLTAAELRSEFGYAPKSRLFLRGATPFEIAVTLQKGAFLCHASAASLHGLTEQVPMTFHVNVEQSVKPRPGGTLSQDAIDRAFRVARRTSKYVFVHGDHRFVQLSGKNTGRHGVIEAPLPGGDGRVVACTILERTLIDLMVRPAYGGGVHEVLAAFHLARERTSVASLLACLRSLDYSYPYHQCLGFYLERAGFADRHVARVRKLPRNFDFYLAHGMTNAVKDDAWRVYHPRT